MNAAKLSTITAADEASWRGKVFVTVDLDWADDELLDTTADLLVQYRIGWTLFATHDSPAVRRLAASDDVEIGIHPNFGRLSITHAQRATANTFAELRAAFPAARSIRSHSLVQSSHLQNEFTAAGFTHDSNTYIPYDAGINLRPWTLWNGLTKVPFVWADDIHLYREGSAQDLRRLRELDLCVLACHPVHLYLNTDSLVTYEKYKSGAGAGAPLSNFVNRTRRGLRDTFIELLDILA